MDLKASIKKVSIALAVGCVIVGGIKIINFPTITPTPHPNQIEMNFTPVVCSAAWDSPDMDMSGFKERSFEVTLDDGCLHEVVKMPLDPAWHKWSIDGEVTPADKTWWYALRPNGETRSVIVTANTPPAQLPRFNTRIFRLAGRKGLKIRFYRLED